MTYNLFLILSSWPNVIVQSYPKSSSYT
jgi:hypothetical protein